MCTPYSSQTQLQNSQHCAIGPRGSGLWLQTSCLFGSGGGGEGGGSGGGGRLVAAAAAAAAAAMVVTLVVVAVAVAGVAAVVGCSSCCCSCCHRSLPCRVGAHSLGGAKGTARPARALTGWRWRLITVISDHSNFVCHQ